MPSKAPADAALLCPCHRECFLVRCRSQREAGPQHAVLPYVVFAHLAESLHRVQDVQISRTRFARHGDEIWGPEQLGGRVSAAGI